MMHWLWSLIGRRDERHPQTDREAFERREAELRERYERLERLAMEVDVMRRGNGPEDWIGP